MEKNRLGGGVTVAPQLTDIDPSHLRDGRPVVLAGFVRAAAPLRSARCSPEVELLPGDLVRVADCWYGPVALEGCSSIYVPLSSLAHREDCPECEPVWSRRSRTWNLEAASERVFKLLTVLVDAESGDIATAGEWRPRSEGRAAVTKCPREGLEASRAVG